MNQQINPDWDYRSFGIATELLRTFFKREGFVEVYTQDRSGILSACEKIESLTRYTMAGKEQFLPQTGQLALARYLLDHPGEVGFFSIGTSYRDEPHPKPGRHQLVFSMFEFETHGDMDRLRQLETKLLRSVGFESEPAVINYRAAQEHCGLKIQDCIEESQEEQLGRDLGPVVLLQNFPVIESFWNMKRGGNGLACKIDALVHGMETIGSAERSTDSKQMYLSFYEMAEGRYASILEKIDAEKVKQELNDLLERSTFPRCGGGIGIPRFIRGLAMSGLLG